MKGLNNCVCNKQFNAMLAFRLYPICPTVLFYHILLLRLLTLPKSKCINYVDIVFSLSFKSVSIYSGSKDVRVEFNIQCVEK